MPVIPYIGVVFSFAVAQSLDRYQFDLLMSLKEMLTFPSLVNVDHARFI